MPGNMEKPFYSNRFVLSVVIPCVLTLLLTVGEFFFIFIPAYEKRMVDDKKETLRELTDTAWSVLDEYAEAVSKGEFTKEKAQKLATERVRKLRYGPERKDYFWISDMEPRMIMHPYQPDLENKDLIDFKGHDDKKIFLEFKELVSKNGSGFLKYRWQWKDVPKRISLKLSYVKAFKPWGWIIGTGVYIDDLNAEISSMKWRLAVISGIVALVIGVCALIVIMQSMKIERSRALAEENLKESREKYKSLVGASTEGMIMIVESEYFYFNQVALDILNCSKEDFIRMDIFELEKAQPETELGEYFQALQAEEEIPPVFEVTLSDTEQNPIRTVISGAKIDFSGKPAYVLMIKVVNAAASTNFKPVDNSGEDLFLELRSALSFLNEPVKMLQGTLTFCSMDSSIQQVAEIMARNNADCVFVKADSDNYAGVVTDWDITRRALAEKIDLDQPVYKIMSSPVVSVDEECMVFQALITMRQKQVNHLATTGPDGALVGYLRKENLLRIQQYSAASLLWEITSADSVEDIVCGQKRMATLVKTFIDGGVNIRAINLIISNISDQILEKFLTFAIADIGPPPVKFSFITLGSEGRREETLVTDQDNAIIYEDPDPEQADMAREYFLLLGEKVCVWLNDAGYNFCNGGIMAKNPEWCQPISQWKKNFATWISEANPDNLLRINVFFDFRHNWGDSSLPRELRESIRGFLQENKIFFIHLANNCLLYKAPLNLFGNISFKSTDARQHYINIKETMKPIVNFARAYALENSLAETNTLERLNKLLSLGGLNQSAHADLVEAYTYLAQIRLRHQALGISANKTPDNEVQLEDLRQIELDTLKNVFSRISTFQTKLSFHFRGVGT